MAGLPKVRQHCVYCELGCIHIKRASCKFISVVVSGRAWHEAASSSFIIGQEIAAIFVTHHPLSLRITQSQWRPLLTVNWPFVGESKHTKDSAKCMQIKPGNPTKLMKASLFTGVTVLHHHHHHYLFALVVV